MKRIIVVLAVSFMIISLYAHGKNWDKEGDNSMNMDKGTMMKMDHMKSDMGDEYGCMKRDNMNMKPNLRDMILSKLELNEDQVMKVNQFEYNYKIDVIDIEAEIDKVNLEKENAMRMSDFAEIKDLNDIIFAKQALLMNKHVELMENIYNQLDKDQKAKWMEFHNHNNNCMHGNNEMMSETLKGHHMGTGSE
jgi:hypothetical protein